MLEKVQSIFRIPELRRRIIFTVLLLIVYRLGGHVPTPGINGEALAAFFQGKERTLFGLYDMFVGGSLSQCTIFAMGIMPYINASIIMQLLGAVIPFLQKLQKEGEEGRKKITQYTRYGTVGLAMIQGYGISIFVESLRSELGAVVPNPGIGFRLLTMITLTCGTIFVMWLGEQITDRGIGNGISLIIFIGIVARFPTDVVNTIRALQLGAIQIFGAVWLAVLIIAVIAAVIVMTQGMRKIPVQYAKRVVGRKMYGGQNTHIPLRVNSAGVIPIIFAQALIMFPGTMSTFVRDNAIMERITMLFSPGTWFYSLVYGAIIVFFTYFYTAIILNPTDLAENIQKHGGFVPGIRAGKRTAEYIDRVLLRITLPGALFLALVAILPDVLINRFHAPFYFGGTSILIVVGVALDTLQQIESHLLMRHYEGFMKKGKIRGRRFM
ncbi:MAG: preprotein translocase subunit SecY [Candidatus Eiseniibacteriota bacterium]|nr:MAG: preprotein translocase subunit SecY [Candidatus Eisenbacteria bacterium]